MEVVSDTELKTVGDKGFGGYGELMRYTFNDDGTVDWIRGATGMRMVPEENSRCRRRSRARSGDLTCRR